MKSYRFLLVLLIAGLAWTPAHGVEIQADINGFDDLETGVIEAAIEWWEMSLPGGGVFMVNITKVPMPGGTRGRTFGFTADGAGNPVRANIHIDTDGAGSGWFVDETPHHEEEFDVGPNGTFIAKPGTAAEGKNDMLSTVKHELAHALGFTVAYANFRENVDDPDPGGGTPRAYTGNDCIWTLTPRTRGTHFCPEEHPGRLIATGRKVGERRLQGKDELKLLADAFGYEVSFPKVQPYVAPIDFQQSTSYKAPAWLGIPDSDIEAEIRLLEVGGDSEIDTDSIRIFLAQGQVHWWRMTRPVGAAQIIESGSSRRAMRKFDAVWQLIGELDGWTMEDGEPDELYEGAATFTYSFTSPDETASFTGYAIDVLDDFRYYELYEQITSLYDSLRGDDMILMER